MLLCLMSHLLQCVHKCDAKGGSIDMIFDCTVFYSEFAFGVRAIGRPVDILC